MKTSLKQMFLMQDMSSYCPVPFTYMSQANAIVYYTSSVLTK